ncbi:MAG: alpha/beta hydrolase [Solirubrobacterales bacterium]|nr:alpha/beta hydrolase [Solirubrobacterales bacterium]MBV9717378.1 alpha/beta hydrolase [Solirubrobacterales bacterium]
MTKGRSRCVVTELDGRRIEYEEIPGDASQPPLVFLHEGLGSVRLWQGFPARVAASTGRRALVYSRFGHGDSDPPPAPRTPAFMHEEAREVLPRLLSAWGAERPVLIGHSDGASIALIHAADHRVTAIVCIAPHVFVEAKSIAEIRRARTLYEQGGRRERMAAHHRDVDAAFYGWNDVWLDPRFEAWNIEELLSAVEVPVLLIQGDDDPYGTLAQIDSVMSRVRGPIERIVLSCRHAPHVQAPEETLTAVTRFVAAYGCRTRAPVR